MKYVVMDLADNDYYGKELINGIDIYSSWQIDPKNNNVVLFDSLKEANEFIKKFEGQLRQYEYWLIILSLEEAIKLYEIYNSGYN